jgi:hypothetical protein
MLAASWIAAADDDTLLKNADAETHAHPSQPYASAVVL